MTTASLEVQHWSSSKEAVSLYELKLVIRLHFNTMTCRNINCKFCPMLCSHWMPLPSHRQTSEFGINICIRQFTAEVMLWKKVVLIQAKLYSALNDATGCYRCV